MNPNERASRLLSADELAPLTRIANPRAAVSVLLTWGVIAVTLASAFAFWSWPIALIAIVIIGTQQHALFILSHDAAHFRLFEGRWLNEVAGRVCAAAAGLSMCTYRVIHRLHHNHLYGPGDPDMALHAGYPRGKWYLVKKLLKDLSGLTAIKGYRYFYGKPEVNAATGQSPQPLAGTTPALRAEARLDQKLVIALHLTLPACIAAVGGLRALVFYGLLWIVPALTVLQVIQRLRAVCEHGAVDDVSSPLTAARTHRFGYRTSDVLARFALFPHHVYYHVEHHLYPAVPHYRLPQLHALLVRRGLLVLEPGSLGSTLRRVFADRASRAA
jgi:fatty acid desaturase